MLGSIIHNAKKIWPNLVIRSLNPFLFIRGLSCPCHVQTLLTQNCLKLTIPGFPYNLLPLSCGAGDIGFLNKS